MQDTSDSENSSDGTEMSQYDFKESDDEVKNEVKSVPKTEKNGKGTEKKTSFNEEVEEMNDEGDAPKKKSWKTSFKKRLSKRTNSMPQSPFMSEEKWAKMKEKELIPIQLHFSHLTFSVPPEKSFLPCMGKKDKEWKTILHDVSGTFEPGSITAIMGSSGAGKTTLLDVLAGRAMGKIEGKILFNGADRKEAGKALLKHQAYVMQADLMLATLTPRELLQFAANLRMPKKYTPEQRKKRVDELIDELNITYCQNTQVGAAGLKRGISGGERKRVAIGIELITNPSLLFLDEPTSGLDSETAENVIDALKVLAEHGRTVICTIHQPNSHIWAKFDQLILMAKGRVVYNGTASKAVDYFKKVGHSCPPFTNPPDFFLSLIHIEQSDPKSAEKIDKLIKDWADSKECAKVHEVQILERSYTEENEMQSFGEKVGITEQIKNLCNRNVLDTKRNPLKVRAMMGQTIFLALILGLTYLQLGYGQSDVQSRSGALYFIVLNQTMAAVFGVLNTFFEEKAVVIRESKNNMYGATSYYASKIISDLPFQIVFPFLFITIIYWMVGFNNDFVIYLNVLAAVLLVSNIGAALGLCISLAAPNASVAIALAPAILIPFLIFSGFLINRDTVPPYFIWCDYLSFVKYGLQIAFVSVFEGQEFHCKESEKIGSLDDRKCIIETGNQVIDNYKFDQLSTLENFLVLIGMFLFYRIFAFLMLSRKLKKAPANL